MTSKTIKEYGLSIGFDQVGIASVDCLPGYIDEVLSREGRYDFFQKMLTRPIQSKMPEAKSIVVMIKDYFGKDFPDSLRQMIGKAYLARHYRPLEGSVEHARLGLMRDYLQKNGCEVNSSAHIPARWVAAHAGLTTFGRNNFAYADEIGSYLVIHTMVVDRQLEHDRPTMENKCPPNCTACIDACPTKALYEPFRLDPTQCLAFNHWMTQDGRGSVSSFIPYEIREKMGCKVYGCDICQDVCPRNQKKRKQPKPMDGYLEQMAPEITLSSLLNMSEDFYHQRVRPILYNYIGDKRYLMRNAAVAMGNSHDARYTGDLELAMEGSDEMVREYAAWALEKIRGG